MSSHALSVSCGVVCKRAGPKRAYGAVGRTPVPAEADRAAGPFFRSDFWPLGPRRRARRRTRSGVRGGVSGRARGGLRGRRRQRERVDQRGAPRACRLTRILAQTRSPPPPCRHVRPVCANFFFIFFFLQHSFFLVPQPLRGSTTKIAPIATTAAGAESGDPHRVPRTPNSTFLRKPTDRQNSCRAFPCARFPPDVCTRAPTRPQRAAALCRHVGSGAGRACPAVPAALSAN